MFDVDISGGQEHTGTIDTVMQSCVAASKHRWIPHIIESRVPTAISGDHTGSRRSTPGTAVRSGDDGLLDPDADPYLLPVTAFNNNVSEYVKYPLLQGHTVLSSDETLNLNRVRNAYYAENVQSMIREIRLEQFPEENENDGDGASLDDGQASISLMKDNETEHSSHSGSEILGPPPLHHIPAGTTHVSPQQIISEESGKGLKLRGPYIDLFTELALYDLRSAVPPKFLQERIQEQLEKQYNMRHRDRREEIEPNDGAQNMEELSDSIPLPASKPKKRKKSIKERVVGIINIQNNSAGEHAISSDGDTTYCHISRMMDTVKLLPITSNNSKADIGLVTIYVNGVQVVMDKKLHDKDIITVVNMGIHPDSISCYKFFQLRIPREAAAAAAKRAIRERQRLRREQGKEVYDEIDDTDDDDEDRTSSGMAFYGSGMMSPLEVGRRVGVSPDEHLSLMQEFLLYGGGSYMTLQEACLWTMYGGKFLEAMVQCEKSRYHELHTQHIDRHMLPTLKSYQTNELSALASYEPELEFILKVQDHMTWEERARICFIFYAISVTNYYAEAMQREQEYKGKLY